MNPEALPIRDIHLPEPVAWWPPAPGWWLFLAILLMATLLSVWLVRKRRARRIKRIALEELMRLRRDLGLTPDEKIRRLSVLLRRTALSAYSRADVAGLSGRKWLSFLDRNLPGEPFSLGSGAVLADAPYRPQVAVDVEPLFELCEAWIKELPETRR